jgi:hypothetical protein
MRFGITVLAMFLLAGCTALVVGGGTSGGYQDARKPEVVASDSAITNEIKGRYGADSGVSMFNIGVRTHSGIVTLTGTVANYVARDQAGRIAKATTGVTAVNNQIVVEK